MFHKINCFYANSSDESSNNESFVGDVEDINSDENNSENFENVKIVEVLAELDGVKAKLADTTDRMMRIAAEFDNSRKRWERERCETRQYAITEFARDLLPVIDAFDSAMTSVENAQISADTEEGQKILAILEGVKLVAKKFSESFKKHGVERVPGKGEPFNPMFHNAVAKVVDPAIECDTVCDEFVAGYRIGERVLRTSMVRVATRE